DGTITVDEDLNIRSVEPLNLRKVYHLHIGLLLDLGDMENAGHMDIRDHADVANELLKILDWRIEEAGKLPKPIGNKIGKIDWKNAIEHVNEQYHTNRTHVNYIKPLIGAFVISAED